MPTLRVAAFRGKPNLPQNRIVPRLADFASRRSCRGIVLQRLGHRSGLNLAPNGFGICRRQKPERTRARFQRKCVPMALSSGASRNMIRGSCAPGFHPRRPGKETMSTNVRIPGRLTEVAARTSASGCTRREFLRQTALAAGAVAAAPAIVRAADANPNDTIRVAIVGVRSKGTHHIQMFSQIPGVRIVAVCDADQDVLRAALRKLEQGNVKADGYVDLRRVLDRKDVDAVVTATPNHWHALFTVWACQAGKDVYVEKPVSHNVWEGRKAVEAARKYNRIVQAGTQSRSDPALREAFAWLQSGQLGKIRLVRGFCYKRRPSIGKVKGPQPIPPNVDYNLWCGPAPMLPLMRKQLHYDWHWVWPTGNGDIGNQGVHEMDMCRWVLGQTSLPPRVMSIGGRFGYVDDGETPNTQIAFFDYQPAPILFEVRGLPLSKDDPETMDHYKRIRIGIVVECEHGYFAGGAGGGVACDADGNRIKEWSGPGGRDHPLNFIQAVRSRKRSDLNADIEEGHLSSALCHLANISHRIGQRSTPDEVRERLAGNADALEAYGRFEAHLAANGVDLNRDLVSLGPWLHVNAPAEQFVGDWSDTANLLLKDLYREPFVIRDTV